MPQPRRRYPPEFRLQLIELARTGRSPESLAQEFKPSAQTIPRNWIQQAERDTGQRTDGLTTPEREELTRLRRELRQVKLEREILAKATVGSIRRRNLFYPPSAPGDVAHGTDGEARAFVVPETRALAAMETRGVAE